MTLPGRLPLRSETCSSHHWHLDAYSYWCAQMREEPIFHRKQWEWFFIAQALHERNMLRDGSRGVGFGVGQEPLPDLFASRGCTIVATDKSTDGTAYKRWAPTTLETLRCGLCNPADFSRRVSLHPVDMNQAPFDLNGFDFCWSSSSLEHLGNLELGLRFITEAMRSLRPGGVAVHTTDINLSSDEQTIAEGGSVVYRRKDIMKLTRRLEADGHSVEPLLVHLGSTSVDKQKATPRQRHQEPHSPDIPILRMSRREGFTTTSVGLIIQARS